MKKIFILIGLLYFALSLTAQTDIRISQIDMNRLFTNQELALYIQGNFPSDIQGYLDSFRIREYFADGTMSFAENLRIQKKDSQHEAVHYFFLIDNSGSMYETLDGLATDNENEYRISIAKRALSRFFSENFDSRDSASLVSFNARFDILLRASNSYEQISSALQRIQRPEPGEGYTELYGSIAKLAELMNGYTGRRVMIVLSDGENYPYEKIHHEKNPYFDNAYAPPQAVHDLIVRSGLSLYGVNFATSGDEEFPEFVENANGLLVSADSEEDLVNVYERIHEQIESELMVVYAPALHHQQLRRIEFQFLDNKTSRYVYIPSQWGDIETFHLAYFFLLIPVFGILFFIYTKRFEHAAEGADLTVLKSDGPASTQVYRLTQKETVIGKKEGDLTFVNAKSMSDNPVTIVHDEKRQAYTIVSNEEIKVNNKLTKNRDLSNGDLITIGSTQIVFDSEIKSGFTKKEN